MKISELLAMEPTEIERIIRKMREELRSMRFKIVLGQQKDVRAIRTHTKDIARLMTVLHKKQHAKQS